MAFPVSRRQVGVALFVVALATADWVARSWRERPAGPASSATTSSLRVLEPPVPLRQFPATDIDGRDTSSALWRGRFTLVNMWATWCAPCRIEIPDLVALQTAYPDRLRVIGILQDQVSVEFTRRFAKALQMNYPIVLSTWDIESAFGETLVLPTSYLVDPDGRIIATHIGPIDVDAIGRLIDSSTKASAGTSVTEPLLLP